MGGSKADDRGEAAENALHPLKRTSKEFFKTILTSKGCEGGKNGGVMSLDRESGAGGINWGSIAFGN